MPPKKPKGPDLSHLSIKQRSMYQASVLAAKRKGEPIPDPPADPNKRPAETQLAPDESKKHKPNKPKTPAKPKPKPKPIKPKPPVKPKPPPSESDEESEEEPAKPTKKFKQSRQPTESESDDEVMSSSDEDIMSPQVLAAERRMREAEAKAAAATLRAEQTANAAARKLTTAKQAAARKAALAAAALEAAALEDDDSSADDSPPVGQFQGFSPAAAPAPSPQRGGFNFDPAPDVTDNSSYATAPPPDLAPPTPEDAHSYKSQPNLAHAQASGSSSRSSGGSGGGSGGGGGGGGGGGSGGGGLKGVGILLAVVAALVALATNSAPPCPPGQFRPEGVANLLVCHSCPADTYKTATGNSRSDCLSCTNGRQSVEGSSSCMCPAGMTNKVPDDHHGQCSSCAKGRYKAAPNTGACDGCQAGQYTSTVGLKACKLCDTGQYAAEAGAAACTLCGNKQTTGRDGSADKAECRCEPGWSDVLQHGVCESCPLHTFKGPEDSKCHACPTVRPAHDAVPELTKTSGMGAESVDACTCPEHYEGEPGLGACELSQAGMQITILQAAGAKEESSWKSAVGTIYTGIFKKLMESAAEAAAEAAKAAEAAAEVAGAAAGAAAQGAMRAGAKVQASAAAVVTWVASAVTDAMDKVTVKFKEFLAMKWFAALREYVTAMTVDLVQQVQQLWQKTLDQMAAWDREYCAQFPQDCEGETAEEPPDQAYYNTPKGALGAPETCQFASKKGFEEFFQGHKDVQELKWEVGCRQLKKIRRNVNLKFHPDKLGSLYPLCTDKSMFMHSISKFNDNAQQKIERSCGLGNANEARKDDSGGSNFAG
jgi:uncharacterized membrane protein YgcG